MLLKRLYEIAGKDAHPHLGHPKFEHFDKVVTILVFADLLPRLGEIIHFFAGTFGKVLIVIIRGH